jgi:ABC-2 type transport system ATP-binding protein
MALNEIKPICLTDVRKSFGSLCAVRDVSLFADRGEVVGLVGPNGCGKSTTLRMAAGLLEADSGEARILGLVQPAVAARSRMAYVPDTPTGFEELTIAEFLRLYSAAYRRPGGFEQRAEQLLEAFHLHARRGSVLSDLSNGMRRLAAMVAAFALQPEVLIVDEATAALDPEAIILFRQAAQTLAGNGTAVLLATQDLHAAEKVCGRVYLLRHGEVLTEGSVEALKRTYRADSLEDVFVNAVGGREENSLVRDALRAG